MKTYDLAALRNLDEIYMKLYGDISENYKCQWDDSIHDSYLSYVKHIDDLSQQVHTIRCAVDTIEGVSDGLQVDELEQKAQDLRWEAETV